MSTVADVMALYHEHSELDQAFDRLISSELYNFAAEGEALPDGWHAGVTQLVGGLHRLAEQIEAMVQAQPITVSYGLHAHEHQNEAR